MMKALQIAILVFDDVEALDLAGPYEVFTTASRVARRLLKDQADHPEAPLWNAASAWQVRCVARTGEPIRARAGLQVVPDARMADVIECDLLVVPGGVVDALLSQNDTLDWVRERHAGTRITASVCTGAFVLAAAGVVQTGPVTTHWEDRADLARRWPDLQVVSGQRWVEAGNGRIITSGGISAGIDMSLHLVRRLAGEWLAQQTARQMEYEWKYEWNDAASMQT